MGRVNKLASKWASNQIEGMLAELLSLFDQPNLTLLAYEDAYIKRLMHKGIKCDKSLTANVSHQWFSVYDVNWGESRIAEIDPVTGIEKKRARTDAERHAYVRALRKSSTSQSARDGFEQHVRCAAEALALDVLRTCPYVDTNTHIAEIVETFDEPPVEISYSPPGRGAGWHYSPTDWEREGVDVLVADLTVRQRLFCSRDAVEVCIVPASASDPLGVRARIWSTRENPWPQGRICDMVECLDGYRLVLKPREGGRFVSTKDDRGPLFG